MRETPRWFRWDGTDLILQVRVQPRAARDGFAGVHEDRLKIRLTAPPVEGRANERLRRYLATRFRVAFSDVTLLGGERGRLKRVRIRGARELPPELGLEAGRG